MSTKLRYGVVAASVLFGLSSLRCEVWNELTGPDSLSIQRFTALPEQVPAGASATLSWEVLGADSVEIDNGIGAVSAKGTKEVKPGWTTVYTLAAKGPGSAAATATVRIAVTPGPTPTPTPSPSPTPTPAPTPTPTPTPYPTPTPLPPPCGSPATSAGNCPVTITRPASLAAGECLEVNSVLVSASCPVGVNTALSLRFDVTARTSRTSFQWRRKASSLDLLDPSTGTINGKSGTTVNLIDTVLGNEVTIEIFDGDKVYLAFSLHH